jgi:hypothetical protein
MIQKRVDVYEKEYFKIRECVQLDTMINLQDYFTKHI